MFLPIKLVGVPTFYSMIQTDIEMLMGWMRGATSGLDRHNMEHNTMISCSEIVPKYINIKYP